MQQQRNKSGSCRLSLNFNDNYIARIFFIKLAIALNWALPSPNPAQYLIKTLQNLPDRPTWVRVILENPAILQSVNILVTYPVVR